MGTSLVPVVKARLIEKLKEKPALAGVHVAYTSSPRDLERESLVLGGQREQSQIGPMKEGRKSRTETVTLDVWVNASRPGQTGQEAEERAYVISAALEDVLAEDPTLGLEELTLGLVFESADAGPQTEPGFEGWEGLRRIRLSYTARLH